MRLLDAIKTCGMENHVRFYQVLIIDNICIHYADVFEVEFTCNLFYILFSDGGHMALHIVLQASTSEMFGKVQEIPQSEKTPFYPRSPYGKFIS